VGKNMEGEKDHLVLKWGTLKDWHFHSEKAKKLMTEYNNIGSSASAMMQKDNPRQKEIICELIDNSNFETVYLDWDSKEVTKEQAKDYVLNYNN